MFREIRLDFDLPALASEMVEQQSIALFRQNRAVYSTAILLAHEMGVVSLDEIDTGFAGGPPAITELYRESLQRIDGQLNALAQAVVGEDDDETFETIGFEFRERDRSLSDGRHHQQVDLVLAVNPRFTPLNLVEIALDLAKVVIGCLHYIQQAGGIGLCTGDIQRTGVGFYLDEELTALQNAFNAGDTGSDRELAERFLEEARPPFNEITDEVDYLEERIGLLRQIIEHNPEQAFGDIPDLKGIRRFFKAHKTQAAYVDHLWWPFIAETLAFSRFVERIKRRHPPKFSIFEADFFYSDCGIGIGHAVGFGFDWEEELVAQLYEDIANAGETPMSHMVVDPLALNATVEKLRILAKARGLLRLAEIIELKQQDYDD
ncbi:hypothetical protein [Methylomonas sp. UP202]|uniref:hypothetical protein n=1 Tax=Methylomonas sp. UP202 TaxID=3040943 RepID=UPI002479CF5D|nr:hypothetical protein [Methylomonas sp. UP202]WGS88577.1 hypothetical protein QC632_24850 [Methylomonas sp. UP202]